MRFRARQIEIVVRRRAPLRLVAPLIAFLAAPIAAQQTPVTIRAGTLLDGRGGVQRDVVVTVTGGLIRAIEPAQAGQSFDYDLSAYTVMPGGIDTHVHIDWHFDPDGRFHHLSRAQESAEQRRAYAEENARVTLMSGITTVQSLGTASDGPLRDDIASGAVVGPRLLTSIRQISRGEPDALRAAVRAAAESGADVIKLFASASIRDGGPPTMSLEQLEVACGEARAIGLRSVVHAHGPESAIRAAQAGCTTIEHGALLDDASLDTLASRGMFYDPSIGLVLQNYLDNRARYEGIGNYNAEGFAQMEAAIPLALDAFRRALPRSAPRGAAAGTPGIRIVFGTDAVAGAHGRNFEELIYRVRQGGQAPMDAIVSATSLAALSLGLQDSIGTLALGWQADLIAMQGDPAQEIEALRRVVFVMKRGIVHRDDAGGTGDSPTLIGDAPRPPEVPGEWPVYGGDPGAMKYSPLADIDRENVARLVPAWEWSTGERAIEAAEGQPAARPGNFQATPLMIGDTLFLSTPFNQVVALDASTGRELWRHDPGAYRYGQPSNGTGFVHRGVASWSGDGERRIFIASRWRLIALDAKTGEPIRSFGENGEVDLTATLRRPVRREHYTNTSPPVVWRDLVIVGNGVGDRLTYRGDPPGDVQAFDARTGRLVWRFNTVPGPGEFGHETWGGESWRTVGHTNVWAPFSVDEARGLVYLPVSTPSNDWYGGDRPGDNLFGESIVCLNASTGERVWHFQTVRHGLWDYDPPAPPVLMTIEVAGRRVDAVALLGKTGFAYVFDRVTGEPVWPIEERPVPASDVPGEHASPTQPFPTKPAPFAQQGFTAADVVDFTPAIRAAALEAIAGLRLGPLFTPPSLEGTLVAPGVIGGAGWGGGAFDPVAQVLYVKASNQPAVMRLRDGEESDTVQARYVFDSRAGVRVRVPAGDGERPLSLPINKPPYGTITAIDMSTGEHAWQVPIGDQPSLRTHPLLAPLDLPPLGVSGAPGPIVTAGGLLFATGGGDVLYALDTRDGRVLWQAELGSRGYAVPMTYRTSDGRQYVVIATGGGTSAVLKAFAVPAGGT